MPFKKGKEKTGGRDQGVQNKSTLAIKNAFAIIVEGNIEQLKEDLAMMKPTDRARLIVEMAEYIIPKQSRVQAEVDLGENTKDFIRPWTIVPVRPNES